MLVRELQLLLRRIYSLNLNADVADYLVTDPDYLHAALGEESRVIKETLLIVEDGDCLEMALYLEQKMLAGLIELNPASALEECSLDDFCKILEGVSHFVYVAWNAGKDKQITQLELEMQAEIDKYISTRLILEAKQSRHPDLLRNLFENVSFDQRLSPEARARYERANDVAGRYCHNLQQRYPGKAVDRAMLQELRAIYRMPQPDMLSHMNAAQFA